LNLCSPRKQSNSLGTQRLEWELDLFVCSIEIVSSRYKSHSTLGSFSAVLQHSRAECCFFIRQDAAGEVLRKHTSPGPAVLDLSAADWAAFALSAALSSRTAAPAEVWFLSSYFTGCLLPDQENQLWQVPELLFLEQE